MPIFKLVNDKLSPILETKISLEKDIQKITEENLETIFGLQFIKSEFPLNSLRIDTLAFDDESKAFVVIEYKKGRSISIVDQGFSYLSLMLNNKADFILEYNERMGVNLKRDEVDWSQSRVIFVAGSFTTHQQGAINFKDLPIELWEVKKYENGMVLYNQLMAREESESISTITKDETVAKVSREVKKYTVDDHFPDGWNNSKELFEILREKVIGISDQVLERPQKHYIAYKCYKDKKYINFLEIVVQAGGLKIYMDTDIDDLNDHKGIVSDCSKVGHWATGNTKVKITSEEDIDYVFVLIKQVYDKLFG